MTSGCTLSSVCCIRSWEGTQRHRAAVMASSRDNHSTFSRPCKRHFHINLLTMFMLSSMYIHHCFATLQVLYRRAVVNAKVQLWGTPAQEAAAVQSQ
jgi:hypothetical protein